MPERFTISPLISRPLPARVLFLTTLRSCLSFPFSLLPILPHLFLTRYILLSCLGKGQAAGSWGSYLGVASRRYYVLRSGRPEAAEGEGMLGAVTERGTRSHSGSEL